MDFIVYDETDDDDDYVLNSESSNTGTEYESEDATEESSEREERPVAVNGTPSELLPQVAAESPLAMESESSMETQSAVETQSASCSQSKQLKTPEKLDVKSKPEASPNKSVDDDGQTCTICFEPWTNSSEHRLVSLRCGHLYGRSCISRWLKGQNSRCPQCNSRARKSEIRNIYARIVKVLDTSDRDRALKALEKECELRRKAEIESTQHRMKCNMVHQECERLKRELMETKQMLHEARLRERALLTWIDVYSDIDMACGSTAHERSLWPPTNMLGSKYAECRSQSANQTMKGFTFEKVVELSKVGGCRIFDVCELLGMIVVAQPSMNELFHGYGFRRLSLMDLKPAEFVLVHQKQIKDMSFHVHDGLVLTASLDRTVKLTSVLTNSVVQTYNLDSDVWSCAWDVDDPIYFFAGEKNGGVFLFDIRVTGRHVLELPLLGGKAPVVALQYLRKTGPAGKCGPLVGKLSSCGFYEKLPNLGSYRVDTLPLSGLFTSLSSEPVTGHFLVSSRPSLKQARVTHTLCEFESSDGYPNFHPVQTIQGGCNQVQLTRSKLLPHPERESSLLVCAGDEDAKGALIWDGSSGTCVNTLRTENPVLDISGLKINHKSYLACLTDKNLRMYGWAQ